jgi:hypothetical protein
MYQLELFPAPISQDAGHTALKSFKNQMLMIFWKSSQQDWKIA